MAARSILSFYRPLSVTLGLSTAFIGHQMFLHPTRSVLSHSSIYSHCSTSPAPISASDWSYSASAKTPLRQNGEWNPKAIRQISTGSILGLIGGIAVSTFSKSLALLIGLLVFGVHFIESRGIHIIPYARMQRYFTDIDVRSTVQDNVAFKLSFGTTFILAAFAKFESFD